MAHIHFTNNEDRGCEILNHIRQYPDRVTQVGLRPVVGCCPGFTSDAWPHPLSIFFIHYLCFEWCLCLWVVSLAALNKSKLHTVVHVKEWFNDDAEVMKTDITVCCIPFKTQHSVITWLTFSIDTETIFFIIIITIAYQTVNREHLTNKSRELAHCKHAKLIHSMWLEENNPRQSKIGYVI